MSLLPPRLGSQRLPEVALGEHLTNEELFHLAVQTGADHYRLVTDPSYCGDFDSIDDSIGYAGGVRSWLDIRMRERRVLLGEGAEEDPELQAMELARTIIVFVEDDIYRRNFSGKSNT